METVTKLELTPEMVMMIEAILQRRNTAEIKIEKQQIIVLETHKRKRIG